MSIQLSQLPGQQEEVNTQVLCFVADLVWEALEKDVEYREIDEAYIEAISKVHKALDIEIVHALENAPTGIADLYGRVMFKIGLAIGRDPATILRLPQGRHIR